MARSAQAADQARMDPDGPVAEGAVVEQVAGITAALVGLEEQLDLLEKRLDPVLLHLNSEPMGDEAPIDASALASQLHDQRRRLLGLVTRVLDIRSRVDL